MRSAASPEAAGSSAEALAELAVRLIRDVPDFPKPGVLFKDIVPLLADAAGFAAVVDTFADRVRACGADLVVGIEARGFVLGAPAAYAAGVGFVPIRKAGKLPAPTRSAAYALEYGEATLELSAAAIVPGTRVLVLDDVLATGGTVGAALRLLGAVDAEVVGVAVLLEIAALGGRAALEGVDVSALVTV